MKTSTLFLMLSFPTLALSGAGDEGKYPISAQLSGYDEGPAISSSGYGEFYALVDNDTLIYYLSYNDLGGQATTEASIHFGQKGDNGGVIARLCGGSNAPPCTRGKGVFSGVINAGDVQGPAAQGIAKGEFAEMLAAMRAGATYVNVHTDLHPGGEIRGQVTYSLDKASAER